MRLAGDTRREAEGMARRWRTRLIKELGHGPGFGYVFPPRGPQPADVRKERERLAAAPVPLKARSTTGYRQARLAIWLAQQHAKMAPQFVTAHVAQRELAATEAWLRRDLAAGDVWYFVVVDEDGQVVAQVLHADALYTLERD